MKQFLAKKVRLENLPMEESPRYMSVSPPLLEPAKGLAAEDVRTRQFGDDSGSHCGKPPWWDGACGFHKSGTRPLSIVP